MNIWLERHSSKNTTESGHAVMKSKASSNTNFFGCEVNQSVLPILVQEATIIYTVAWLEQGGRQLISVIQFKLAERRNRERKPCLLMIMTKILMTRSRQRPLAKQLRGWTHRKGQTRLLCNSICRTYKPSPFAVSISSVRTNSLISRLQFLIILLNETEQALPRLLFLSHALSDRARKGLMNKRKIGYLAVMCWARPEVYCYWICFFLLFVIACQNWIQIFWMFLISVPCILSLVQSVVLSVLWRPVTKHQLKKQDE